MKHGWIDAVSVTAIVIISAILFIEKPKEVVEFVLTSISIATIAVTVVFGSLLLFAYWREHGKTQAR